MGKFFNKGPNIKICNMCGEEKLVFKSMRKGFTSLNYCQECYEGTYKKIEDRVRKYIMKEAKAGKMISIADTTKLTKKITAEIEAENAKKDEKKNEERKEENV